MQRIETLLQKIQEMSARGSKNTVIDIDLMLDYVKVVYADLLEMRSRVVFTSDISATEEQPVAAASNEPVAEKSPPVISTVTPDPTQSVVETLETPAIVETVVQAPVTEVITVKEEIPVAEEPKEEPKPVEQYNPPVKHDIRKTIGINDKYLFMSELFKDNKDMYEKTLDEINNQDSYDRAMDWLNENVLFTNDADGNEQETVQLFYDTVNKFFSER